MAARSTPFLCALLLLAAPAWASVAPAIPTFVSAWGNQGAAAGQFNSPSGVATDELGNLYVADKSNHRIQKFDRLGNPIAQWGSFGSANGQFANPGGVVVDRSGNVYVTDGGNLRVQKFTSTGVYLTQWGSFGSGPGQFTSMSGGPATDAAGNVYVASAYRVQKFSSSGSFVTEWGSQGSGDGQFEGANAIAIDPAGNVYVVDRLNLRVQKFTSAGAYLGQFSLGGNTSDVATDPLGNVYVVDDNSHVTRHTPAGVLDAQWGSPGSGNGQFDAPKSLDVDLAGQLYDAHTFNHPIQKLSGAGATSQAEPTPAYLLSWGVPGSGNGEFSGPHGMATDAAGNVYVVDFLANRVQKFSSTGAYLTQWFSPGVPSDVATDAAGNVYVTNQSGHQIRKYTSTGALIHFWGSEGGGDGQFLSAYGLATDAAGNVYVVDRWINQVQKFTGDGVFLARWGTPGTGNGQFNTPMDVAVDAAGNVYVADNYNHRIQKFTSTGTYIGQWGTNGTGDGQFDFPLGLAVDAAGNLYVTDDNNNRVQKFTTSGAHLATWGSPGAGPGQFAGPKGIAVDPAGNVYVSSFFGNNVQKFVTSPAIAMVSDVRNDQGKQSRLRILRSSADVAGSGATITGYAIYRRIDPLASPTAASFAPSAATPATMELAGWEYVATIPARGDAEYNAVVPTLTDAQAATRDYTAFFVSALTATPTTYYDSAVESGFSIDNLSPPPPTPFTAAYAAGATHLHWGVSAASDFAIFRLYRGGSADFVPGPGNRIATTNDTGFVDAGEMGGYYKLSAVDWSGNESPFALLSPGQTTDVPATGPMDFALEGSRPCPAIGGRLRVHFRLPDHAPAVLELFDLTGRRMARHAVGRLGPGRHAVDMAPSERLPSGVYLVRLSREASQRSLRIAVLR